MRNMGAGIMITHFRDEKLRQQDYGYVNATLVPYLRALLWSRAHPLTLTHHVQTPETKHHFRVVLSMCPCPTLGCSFWGTFISPSCSKVTRFSHFQDLAQEGSRSEWPEHASLQWSQVQHRDSVGTMSETSLNSHRRSMAEVKFVTDPSPMS